MPGENEDDLTLETPNEGLEAEANASDQDGDEAEVGDELEGAAEGDGAESEGQEVEGEPQRRPPTRGEARFQTLSKTAKQAVEDAATARREAADLRERLSRLEQPRQAAPQGPTQEEIALMTPQEYADHKFKQSEQRFQQQLGQIQWQTYEAGDTAAWSARVQRDPHAARLATQVEQRLQELRAKGQNVDRERLYTYMIGEEVLAKTSKAKSKQAGEGQRRIARQQTRPGSSQRSDTAPARGKLSEQEAREKRLENQTF